MFGNLKLTYRCNEVKILFKKAKSDRRTVPETNPEQGKHNLELVYTNICTPIQTPTIGGKTYFFTFIDDFSRFRIIVLIFKKSEILEKLKKYIRMTINLFGENYRHLVLTTSKSSQAEK